MGKLERKYLAHFIDAGMGGAVTRYVRLGKDLETYSEELNPQVSIQRNLKGTPNVVMDGYQVQSQVESYYAYSGDLLFEVLSYIANDRLTDDSCKTTKVDALYDENGEQIWAYREDCWIVPTSVGGDTSGVQIPFSVYCEGNRTYGTFDLDARTFTPAEEPERPSGGGTVELVVTENGKYVAPENTAYNPVIVQISSAAGEAVVAKYIEGTVSGYVYNSIASRVGPYAFTGNSRITSVEFPAATWVNDYAFSSCSSLTAVSMNSCRGVGSSAFYSCRSLAQVTMDSCWMIGSYAFAGCSNLTSVSFPACSTVSAYAFSGTPVGMLDLPLLTSAESHAFYGCGISSVNFPALSAVKSGIFDACGSLKSVVLPAAKTIYSYAFSGAYTEYVGLPSCSALGSRAFTYCSRLVSVDIPNCSVIGSYAFSGCTNLKVISLPACTNIWSGAFYECGLESINMPLATGTGNFCFQSNRSLVSASFPVATAVGYDTFNGCTVLSNVSLPEVAWVGARAFQGCYSLSTLSLPKCSFFYLSVFSYCYRLISLYLMSTSVVTLSGTVAQTFGSTPLYNYSVSAGMWGTIYVPASLLASYKADAKWSVISSRFSGI